MNGLYIHGHLIVITVREIIVGLAIDGSSLATIIWWKKGHVIRK
jgi:hypothetical protein